MFVTVTIRFEAETRQELIDEFGAKIAIAREHFEELRKEGVFGDPALTALRFILHGGGICPTEEKQ